MFSDEFSLKKGKRMFTSPEVAQSEQKILLRAIFDTLVPKLVAQDKPLMQSLISGVFPGADVGIVDNQVLQEEPLSHKRHRGHSLLVRGGGDIRPLPNSRTSRRNSVGARQRGACPQTP